MHLRSDDAWLPPCAVKCSTFAKLCKQLEAAALYHQLHPCLASAQRSAQPLQTGRNLVHHCAITCMQAGTQAHGPAFAAALQQLDPALQSQLKPIIGG